MSDIIYEFDLNPSSKTTGLIQQLIFRKPDKYSLPWNGFLGASPAGISGYLTYHGVKHETTGNSDTLKSWHKEGRIFIILLLNDKDDVFKGTHYMTLLADNNGTYSAFNHYSNSLETRDGVELDDVIGNGALIMSYYIQGG